MFTKSEGWWIALLTLVAGIEITSAAGRAVGAVSLEAKVTDTEAGSVFTTTPATGGTIISNSTTKDHTLPGNPSFTVTSTASGPTSYAYASVSDAIVSGVAKKTVAPTVIVKPGYPTGHTTAYADPTGAVTLQVDPSSINPNQGTQGVNMLFSFPDVTSNDVDHTISDNLGANLLGVSSPSQGIVRDSAGLTTAQQNGAFNVVYSVNASAFQNGTFLFTFSGTATFVPGGPGQGDTVTFGGGFSNPTTGFQSSPDTTNPNAIITTLTGLPSRTFQVESGSPFTLTVDATMSIGDENETINLSANPITRNLGVIGLFTTGAAPVDRPDFVVKAIPTIIPGDFNFDGSVNATDIPSMMRALANLSSFETTNNLTNQQLMTVGDVNHDGKVSNADLQSLIHNLIFGGGSATAVPEPGSALLLGFGLVAIVCGRRYTRTRSRG
jgi:hypothetical protein